MGCPIPTSAKGLLSRRWIRLLHLETLGGTPLKEPPLVYRSFVGTSQVYRGIWVLICSGISDPFQGLLPQPFEWRCKEETAWYEFRMVLALLEDPNHGLLVSTPTLEFVCIAPIYHLRTRAHTLKRTQIMQTGKGPNQGPILRAYDLLIYCFTMVRGAFPAMILRRVWHQEFSAWLDPASLPPHHKPSLPSTTKILIFMGSL